MVNLALLSPIIYGLTFTKSEAFYSVSVAICFLVILQKVSFIFSYVVTQKNFLPYIAKNADLASEIALNNVSSGVFWIAPFRIISYSLVFISFFIGFQLLILALAVYLMTFTGSLQHSTIPAAIYLGASSPNQLDVCRKLTLKMKPLRVVSLMVIKNRALDYMVMIGDNYRVDGSEEWRKTVHMLIDNVFVVFLDTRKLTDATLEEAEYVFNKEIHDKLVVIYEKKEELEELKSSLGCVNWLDEVIFFDLKSGDLSIFERLANVIIDSGGALPSGDHPLRAVLSRELGSQS